MIDAFSLLEDEEEKKNKDIPDVWSKYSPEDADILNFVLTPAKEKVIEEPKKEEPKPKTFGQKAGEIIKGMGSAIKKLVVGGTVKRTEEEKEDEVIQLAVKEREKIQARVDDLEKRNGLIDRNIPFLNNPYTTSIEDIEKQNKALEEAKKAYEKDTGLKAEDSELYRDLTAKNEEMLKIKSGDDPKVLLEKNKETLEAYNNFIENSITDRGFIKAFIDSATDKENIPLFIGDVVSGAEFLSDYAIIKKYNRGEALTQSEQDAFENIRARGLEGMTKIGLGDKVGSMVGAMPKYAVEFALTGGVYTTGKALVLKGMGKTGARIIAKEALKETGEQAIKFTMKEQAARLATGLIASAAQTTAFVPTIASKTAEYMIPEYGIIDTKEGNKALSVIDEGDSFTKALAKAGLTTYIEILTERSGFIVEDGTSFIKKAILGKYITKMGITNPSTFSKVAKLVGWNGIIAEVFEEDLAELGQAPIEERQYYAPWTPEGLERILVETLGITAFGGIGKAIATVTDASGNISKDRKMEGDVIELPEVQPEALQEVTEGIKEEVPTEVKKKPTTAKKYVEEKGVKFRENNPVIITTTKDNVTKEYRLSEFADKEGYIYHSTTPNNLDGITKEGLKLSEEGYQGKGVYFAPDEASTTGQASYEGMTVRVNVKNLDTDQIISGDVSGFGDPTELVYGKNIPASAIEVKTKTGWKPLVKATPLKEKYYHGTPKIKEIQEKGFDLGKAGSTSGYKGVFGRGIYITPEEGRAKLYGTPMGVDISKANLWEIDANNVLDELYTSKTKYGDPDMVADLVKSKGYDGVRIVNKEKGMEEVAIFKPETIGIKKEKFREETPMESSLRSSLDRNVFVKDILKDRYPLMQYVVNNVMVTNDSSLVSRARNVLSKIEGLTNRLPADVLRQIDGLYADVKKKVDAQDKYIDKKEEKFRTAQEIEREELTTKILKALGDRKTVSKQFITDLLRMGDVKKAEIDIINEALKGEGNTVDVERFKNRVSAELLPLEARIYGYGFEGGARYHNITLPMESKGDVDSYHEVIYTSPVENTAGSIHFRALNIPNYFGHVRIEEMADGITRRGLEFQSDLYQKKNMEMDLEYEAKERWQEYLTFEEDRQLKKALFPKEYTPIRNEKDLKTINKLEKVGMARAKKAIEDKYKRLKQYNDPTAHFRMAREEIRRATNDGKKILLFPSGETAMQIEGLGRSTTWALVDETKPYDQRRLANIPLKVGMEIQRSGDRIGDTWIIQEVLENRKFKAVPKSVVEKFKFDNINEQLLKRKWDETPINDRTFKTFEEYLDAAQYRKNTAFQSWVETFDASGQVDTSNPIYKFYDSVLGKYLTSKFNARKITDAQGVTWFQVDLKPEYANAVEAFRIRDDFAKKGVKITAEEEKRIKALHSQFFPDKDIKVVEQIVYNNKALGSYFDNMIKIVDGKGDPTDTLLHEAVHKYMDVFLTRDEHIELLNIGAEKYGINDYEEIEERIAEDFIKYFKDRRTLKGRIKAIFEKISNVFSSYSKGYGEINKLYEDIFTGKAKAITKTAERAKAVKAGMKVIEGVKPKVVQPEKRKVLPSARPVSAPFGRGKIRSSGFVSRVQEELLQSDLTRYEFNEETGKYNQMNLEQDAMKAVTYLEKNPEKAVAIGLGLIEAPGGQTTNAIGLAAALKAQQEGNFGLYKELITSISLRATRQGQEIVTLRGQFNGHSAESFIKRVIDTRMQNLASRLVSDVEAKGKKLSYKEKVNREINRKTSEAKKSLTNDMAKIKSAQDIIDAMRC